MINLTKYYLDNRSDYYNRFFLPIAKFGPYFVNDADEVVAQFRTVCKPEQSDQIDNDTNDTKFILLCFWLNKHGYQIKQFPNVLSRPTTLHEFANKTIRDYIVKRDKQTDTTVTWSKRRILCDELVITSDKIFQDIPDELGRSIKLISTRGADFDGMEADERLSLLNNLIENLLKVNGNFINVPDKVFMGFITNGEITDYRRKTQCFRHASKESLKERTSFSDKEKTFLIDLGVFIAIHIDRFLRNPNREDT